MMQKEWYKESDINKINEIIDSYHLFDSVFKKNKYQQAFVDYIYWVNRVVDTSQWTNSNILLTPFLPLRMLVFLAGILRSIFCTRRIVRQGKCVSNYEKSRIVAVPFANQYNRFKYLTSLTEKSISLDYPPLYNFTYIYEHLSFFKERGIRTKLNSFSFSDFFFLFNEFILNGYRIIKCSRDLDYFFKKNNNSFFNIYVNLCLYKHAFDRIVKSYDTSPKLWIMEYDFDPKYIIMASTIKKNRPSDAICHMQHGAFRGFNYCYCNPVSDYSLCCCEREKNVIEEYNKFGSNIRVLGASLQSFENAEETSTSIIDNDILILLSDFETQSDNKQIILIEELLKNGFQFMIRYRPASREQDKRIIDSRFRNIESTENSTLREDIIRSKIVISFSEDAIFECFRHKRKTVYICDKEDLNLYGSNTRTENIIVTDLQGLHTKDISNLLATSSECNYSDDAFVLYNFGDFRLERVKNNFNSILNEIIGKL